MGWQEYLFFTFPSILVILNPLGAAVTFASLTAGRSEKQRFTLARRACTFSFGVLILFALLGHIIFKMFGITLGAFRIAGGFLLFSVAWQMLHANPVRSRVTDEEFDEGLLREDVAIVPVAIPLLSGPGAITTVLVLSGGTSNLFQTVAVIGCAGVALFICYLVLSRATRLVLLLQVSGTRVVTRIMGLILSVVAVQFVIEGIKNVLPGLAKILKSA